MLFIVLYFSLTPVHAQTTSITQLTYPSTVIAGSLNPIPVNLSIPYNNTKLGYWLLVGIVDQQMNNSIVPGNVLGSPYSCLDQPIAKALCKAQLSSASGVESLQFKIGGIFANVQPTPGTWNLQVISLLLDSNNTVLSRSSLSFMIYLTPIILTLDLPGNATVRLDGKVTRGGSIPVAIGRHTISISTLVMLNGTDRLIFDRWSDGSIQPNRTLFVSSNSKLAVVYHTQHLLIINSNVVGVNVAGAGWYDNGSFARFSVNQVQVPTGGVLDLLGAKTTFQGWFEAGKLLTSSTFGTVEMNRSHTITAQWMIDYTIPLIYALVCVGVGLGTYFVFRHQTGRDRRRRSKSRRSRVRVKRPRVGSRFTKS